MTMPTTIENKLMRKRLEVNRLNRAWALAVDLLEQERAGER